MTRWHLTSVESRLLLESVCTGGNMTSYFSWKQTSVGECVQGWQNHILQISWHLLRWCIHAHHFFMQVKALSLWSWARHLPSYSMPQNTPWFWWMNLVCLPPYLPPHPMCSVQWIAFKKIVYVYVRVCMCVWEREIEGVCVCVRESVPYGSKIQRVTDPLSEFSGGQTAILEGHKNIYWEVVPKGLLTFLGFFTQCGV